MAYPLILIHLFYVGFISSLCIMLKIDSLNLEYDESITNKISQTKQAATISGVLDQFVIGLIIVNK